MADAGLFVHLGLPENPNFKELDKIWNRGILSSAPNPITCLAAIMTSPVEVSSVIFETKKQFHLLSQFNSFKLWAKIHYNFDSKPLCYNI